MKGASVLLSLLVVFQLSSSEDSEGIFTSNVDLQKLLRTEEEIVREIEIIIETHKANDIKDMGKVMGIASKKFAGKADNNIVAEIVGHLIEVPGFGFAIDFQKRR